VPGAQDTKILLLRWKLQAWKNIQTCAYITKGRILGNFEVFFRFTVHPRCRCTQEQGAKMITWEVFHPYTETRDGSTNLHKKRATLKLGRPS
jgi:hypothetical protein